MSEKNHKSKPGAKKPMPTKKSKQNPQPTLGVISTLITPTTTAAALANEI